MKAHSIHIAVVGLGFGSAFVPIYQRHPNVAEVSICEIDSGLLNKIGDRFAVAKRFSGLEDVLNDDEIDAVHLLTPVPYHVEHSLAVLKSGKHCACAVPMATSLEGIAEIIEAQKSSGRNYMMMETGVYDRAFLFAAELMDRGEFGTITHLRGEYFQDLEGAYPAYWRAQPPMHYSTHVLGPLLGLAKTWATSAICVGSGRLRPDIQMPGGNIYPLQTAIFNLHGVTAVAQVTKSWFQTARSYTESFSVYGDAKGFEWQQLHDENPVLFTLEPLVPEHRGRHVSAARVALPDRRDLLPAEIAEFTDGWHGGSHPHLVHEFVTSIVENRRPRVDAITAAEWTAPGICANDSCLQGGVSVPIPVYRDEVE